MMKDVLLFIRIFAGIVWVGGLLFVVWGVYPAARLLPVFKQKHFGITGPTHSLSQLVTTYYGK